MDPYEQYIKLIESVPCDICNVLSGEPCISNIDIGSFHGDRLDIFRTTTNFKNRKLAHELLLKTCALEHLKFLENNSLFLKEDELILLRSYDIIEKE